MFKKTAIAIAATALMSTAAMADGTRGGVDTGPKNGQELGKRGDTRGHTGDTLGKRGDTRGGGADSSTSKSTVRGR